MLKRHQSIVTGIFRISDATVIVAAWLLAYAFRFYTGALPVTKGHQPFSEYLSLTPVVAVSVLTVFELMRVYESKRTRTVRHELGLVLRALALSIVIFISTTYWFDQYRHSRLAMLCFGALSATLLVIFRLTVRSTLRALRENGFNLRHVLLVGEGPATAAVVTKLSSMPELGLRVRGLVTEEGGPESSIGGVAVLGSYDQLTEIIASTRVDEVIIAMPATQSREVAQVLELLRDETVDVRLIPDVHAYVTLGCEVEDVDGIPIVRINDSPLIGWGAVAKRCTDFVLSLVGIVILSPLLLLIALLIKLTSRGPILYAQERMGLDGRTFQMLKFRSMKVDAEVRTGAVWARADDDRRTVLGTILRKTSLDELPQLWNVLCGDMSLVGPRPERPVFVHQFRKQIPHYMLRHKVKAGITGWAQVNGWRGNTSLDRRIECDLYYIQNWSYALDWKILTMTLWKGFVNKNAY